ncbi:dTDP-4-dehydrorhamnose 3,5-epimerase [Roseomonas eburnea]|uniref:dTDP-4-dehydrorhamnose 3,5-epimerase n=1 Tax=Neoroseomonas eburnea TaxID=1346889 RepID=A0A9X9X5S4_9PROT|nr:polysaccharide pyruvyl transferase family protein [Neoroseomonas eburnea]MBR0679060.1 dTDP-4-dehydrorhamnose 3,5-epimerase [Neoroseomonas eburnea]
MPGEALDTAGNSIGRRAGASTGIASGRRPRIALLGQFGAGNLGNDASLEAMLRMIRTRIPGAGVTVICSRPDIVSETFGLPAVAWIGTPPQSRLLQRLNGLLLKVPHKLLAPSRAAGALRGCDVLVVPGTGFLDDFGERAAGGPFAILSWVLAARLMRCRVVMASIGAGPIHSRASRILMMAAARLAHHLTFRDAASRDFVVRHAHVRRPLAVYPDLAFALPAELQEPPAGARPLALGVMRYRGWGNEDGSIYRTYIAKLARFARGAIEGGRRVRLVIGEAGDEEAVRDLRSALAAAGGERLLDATEYAAAHDIHDVIRQMAGAELAVATRFHNVVGALMAGTPVISLSYGAKNDILLTDMGLGAFCAHVETFDPDWLAERVMALAAERERHAAIIRERTAAYRTALSEQSDVLCALIGGGGANGAPGPTR